MRVFHGSSQTVAKPQLGLCRPNNDYGRAFYCTFDKDLAREWACRPLAQQGFVNIYDLELDSLQVLDLLDQRYGVLNWMAVLLENRRIDKEWFNDIETQAFIEKYRVDLTQYDVVTGYRADDSYFSIARAFAFGGITVNRLEEALRLGNLGTQIALRTKNALDCLTYVGCEEVDVNKLSKRRALRDSAARAEFQRLKRAGALEKGKRFFDLLDLREGDA